MVRGSMFTGACARRACQHEVHVSVQCMCVSGCVYNVCVHHGYGWDGICAN